MLTVTLSDGTTLSGSAQEIFKYLEEKEKVSNSPKYKSETKGLICIEDMTTSHIINALLKKVRKWEQSLHNASLEELIDALKNGVWIDLEDEEFDLLFEELKNRQ